MIRESLCGDFQFHKHGLVRSEIFQLGHLVMEPFHGTLRLQSTVDWIIPEFWDNLSSTSERILFVQFSFL